MATSMDLKEKTITPAELPLCCPPIDEVTWKMHPRVYLKPNEKGEAVCPYCSTHYSVKK